MNWGNAAIGKINSVLHGLDAKIMVESSTITDPAFKDAEGKIAKFSLVLANFPFTSPLWLIRLPLPKSSKPYQEQNWLSQFWWLPPAFGSAKLLA